MAVTHAKVSAKSDGADTSEVRPSDWNADHTIAAGTVTLAQMADLATARLIGRTSSGTGVPEALSVLPAALEPAHTGDVTNTAGSLALTIANDAVTYAKLQNVAANNTVLGRISGAGGNAEELTAANIKTILALAGSEIAFTPVGTIAATDVQTAIAEVATDYLALRKHFTTFSKQGAVAITTEGDTPPPMRVYNDTGRTLTFAAIRATATTGPAGATMVIDVNVDGTTIMTGTKVVIADGGNTVLQTTFSTTTVADGHYVSMNVDSVGSGTAGSNLTVSVWCTG